VVIELLKIKVPPIHREKFIQKDAEIWTAALTGFPGFLSKEVWIDPFVESEVILVIHWTTREQWKSIKQEDLDAIARHFDQEVGYPYEIVESSEYQVRKFPQS
jgi:uncharacterized protein (TIGR03792 family)